MSKNTPREVITNTATSEKPLTPRPEGPVISKQETSKLND